MTGYAKVSERHVPCSDTGTSPRARYGAGIQKRLYDLSNLPRVSPYQMLHPPSTIRLCPVIHDPAGEASSATAPFKSSGIPERWSAFA